MTNHEVLLLVLRYLKSLRQATFFMNIYICIITIIIIIIIIVIIIITFIIISIIIIIITEDNDKGNKAMGWILERVRTNRTNAYRTQATVK